MNKLGNITKMDGFGDITSLAGGALASASNKADGKKSVGLSTAAGALKGAGIGANPALMALTGGLSPVIGAGIGAGVNLVTSITGNKKLEEREDKLRQLEATKKAEMHLERSKNILNVFPTGGVESHTLYAKNGGKIPAYRLSNKGLINLNGAQKVVGATHEQGGVKLHDATGAPAAEVEKNEIIFKDQYGNNNVLSDELQTAKIAEAYMKSDDYKKELAVFDKTNNDLNMKQRLIKDKYGKNSFERTQKLNNHPLQAIFDKQEEMKKQASNNPTFSKGVPKYKDGGQIEGYNFLGKPNYDKRFTGYKTMYNNNNLGTPTKLPAITVPNQSARISNFSPSGDTSYKYNAQDINNLAANILPFVDNIYNAKLNKNTPDIPVPLLNKAAPLQTTLNYQPQIRRTANELGAFYKNIDNTVSNTGVALTNKQAAFSNALKNYSDIYGDKFNKETALKNSALLNSQAVDNQNRATMNDYNYKKMLRKDDMQQRASANMSNAVDDAMFGIREKNLGELDKKKLDLISRKYKNKGTLDRQEIDWLMKSLKGNNKTSDER
jgi:hypothetical protein